MKRLKLFLENFFAYGFINILNKVIPLLLLPVITRLLSDPSDFGVYDMYNTIIGFGSPLVMLGMYDAMFREYFEKDDQQYRYNVTTTANRIVLVTSFIGGAILILFNSTLSNIFFGTSIYGIVVVLAGIELFIATNTSTIAAPSRIENKRRVYVFSGLLRSIAYYVLAIAFIYFGYSFYGMIYGNIISSVLLLAFFFLLNRKYFTKGKFDKNIARELFNIGLPLVPTFMIYWIYNSMDKLMITNMLGTNELGIYSIGSKFASISSLVYAAFSGGWQFFSFSTMKDEDQINLNSKVFEYLGVISFASLIILYPFIPLAFNILFPESYASGISVVPYLYLSPLLLMLFQVVANQFIIIKKSYWSTISLSVGAVANVLLNWLLIPQIGIEGAALATLIGYVLSVIVVSLLAIKLELHVVTKRFLLVTIIITLYLLLFQMSFFNNFLKQIVLSLISLLLYASLFKDEIRMTILKLKEQLNKPN